jgi:hypothetical protein
MSEVWYENPEILLNNLQQFIPNKKLSKIDNINSIARFAIYLAIFILLLKFNNIFLILPLLILFISYYLNKKINNKPIVQTELNKPIIVQDIINPESPTIFKTSFDNPYMNYITNNRSIDNPESFPQLLPNNILVNNDLITSLNSFSKSTINTNSQIITPKIILKTSPPNNIQGSIPLTNDKQVLTNEKLNDKQVLTNEKLNDKQVLTNEKLNDKQVLTNEKLNEKQVLTNEKLNEQQVLTNEKLNEKQVLTNDKSDLEPYIDNSNYQTSNNTINYDLCITSNNNKSCSPQNKIIDNPYNLSDNFKDKKLKKEIRNNFKSHLKFDSMDMWGTLINDRNYYTSPNIELVNDQSGFAEWCYTNNGLSGKCKTDGNNCVKDRDIRYHKGRISTNN